MLIDEKGRILGKINIIDAFVLLFIFITITSIFWLSYTGDLSRNLDPAKKLFIEKNITAIVLDQELSTIELIENKTATTDELSVKIINASINSLMQQNNKYNILLQLKIKTFHDKFLDTYYFNETPLIFGNTIRIESINKTATILCS